MPGEFGGGYVPPEATKQITQNNPNINNMSEKKELQAERGNFDKRMSELANELNVPKADLIADYADEEHAAREADKKELKEIEDPELRKVKEKELSILYDSKTVERLINKTIIEKVKAGRDSLTGINNRSSLNQEIERRNKDVEKHDQSSIIMIDIDKFKLVNDTYGHQGGDYVLKEVATALKETMREGDKLFRYGGEEIVLLTSNTTGNPTDFAERLRKVIEDKKFVFNGQNIKVTISAGVSPHDENLEKMIKNADTGLYLAKGDAKKLTEGIKVEPGHEGKPTRNQVWYLDKEAGEYKRK